MREPALDTDALTPCALSISRGRLAAEVGADKSVVGRWASGAVLPSPHNLERLTHFVAARSPGFTLLDWDHDLPALAGRFGIAVPAAPVAAGPGPTIAGLLPLPIIGEAIATGRIRGADYEGFWKTTRPSNELPGMFAHDQVIIQKTPDGLLRFRLGVFDIRFDGIALPMQNQLFGIATDITTGTFLFLILNGVARQKAHVLDGVTLTCRRDAGGTPVAAKVLLERVGELSGDAAADTARHDELAAINPFVPAAQVPQQVRDHLLHDIGPTAEAAGGDALMMITLAKTQARGPGFEDTRAV